MEGQQKGTTSNFCDTSAAAAQDVIHTGTPFYTPGGHSGGALRFADSPFSVRGTLSQVGGGRKGGALGGGKVGH